LRRGRRRGGDPTRLALKRLTDSRIFTGPLGIAVARGRYRLWRYARTSTVNGRIDAHRCGDRLVAVDT
jgi:hypothetical protein